MAPRFVIRPPAADELARLVEIEAAAGRAFADHGMPEIAADDTGTPSGLEEYRAAGRAWVAADRDGPIAYLLADVVARLGPRAHHVEIAGGDHSFRVPGGPRDAALIGASLAEPAARFIRAV